MKQVATKFGQVPTSFIVSFSLLSTGEPFSFHNKAKLQRYLHPVQSKRRLAASRKPSQARFGKFSPIPILLSDQTQFLHNCHSDQTIDRYVNFVFRSIETIKFTKRWNDLDTLPRGRSIKKHHLLQLFKSLHINLYEDLAVAENTLNAEIEQRGDMVDLYRQYVQQQNDMIEENLRVFKGKHCRVITARNTLLSMYTKFGNAVLFDPIWDAASQNTASGLPGRSDSFRALVGLFCKGEPTIDPGAEEAFQNITSALGISGVVDV